MCKPIGNDQDSGDVLVVIAVADLVALEVFVDVHLSVGVFFRG